MSKILGQPGGVELLRSSENSQTFQTRATNIEVATFGVQLDDVSTARTWPPIGSPRGDQLEVYLEDGRGPTLRLEDIHFSVVRYDKPSPSHTGCYMNFRSDWRQGAWRSVNGANDINPGPVTFVVEALRSDGGTVETLIYSETMWSCPGGDVHLVLRQKDIEWGLFDIITGWKIAHSRVGWFLSCDG